MSAFGCATGEEMFGLGFVNTYLLWGLAGAAIPVLIHLINRRRFRTVPWGAMEFLVSSSKMTARRLKILQALLLLTRMGIVSFLVMGVARPYLTGGFWGGALARSKSSAVIVVDNSYSMGLREGDETSFEVAKGVAGRIVSSFRRGDSLTYILMAGRPRVVTEGNPSPERVRRLVEGSELCDEGTDIFSAVLRGLEILDSEKNTRKELFLITDCQRNGWDVSNAAGWEKVNKMLSEGRVRPRVYVFDVSRKCGENITVSSVRLPASPCGVGKRYLVEVSARSSAEKPARRPVFTLFLDDENKEVARAEGSEFREGISRGRLVFSVEKPGFHWGKVEVGADCLEADNARYFSVKAKRAVPILCVDGGAAGESFEGGIGYLVYAFAPEKGLEMEGVSNVLDPKVVSEEQFWEEEVGRYDIVVLSNVGGIPGRMYEELSDFVWNGGGLMIFLGDNVDPVEYSELYRSGGKSLLPCAIGSAKGKLPGEEGGEKGYRITEVDYRHAAMARFKDGAGGDLSTAKFYKFFSVKPDEREPDVHVLARLGDGTPYMVEKKFGRGKTILFTSSCDARWSNLPLKPAFLPLVHRIAYYLAGSVDERHNLSVGDKIVERVEGEAWSGGASITDPTGARFKVVVERGGGEKEEEDKPVVRFEETSRAGIYAVRTSGNTAEKAGEGGGEKARYFAVNVETEESDLSVLGEEVMRGLIRSEGFRYLKEGAGAVEGIRELREGKEVWRFVLVGVLCFLVLESVLARQIDKG